MDAFVPALIPATRSLRRPRRQEAFFPGCARQ